MQDPLYNELHDCNIYELKGYIKQLHSSFYRASSCCARGWGSIPSYVKPKTFLAFQISSKNLQLRPKSGCKNSNLGSKNLKLDLERMQQIHAKLSLWLLFISYKFVKGFLAITFL